MTTYRDRLTSLTTHLRKYEKPTPHGYDTFATTFLAGDIEWKRILSDETDSCAGEPLPFSTQFRLDKYVVEEKERKLRGASVRRKDLLPSSHQILEHLEEAKGCEAEEHLVYLYFKAMQYCETNKALALDEKYPKPDCDVVRKTFSKEHQAAVLAVRARSKELRIGEAPFQQPRRQLIDLPKVVSTSASGRVMATEDEKEALTRVRLVIAEALGKHSPVRDMRVIKEPWQFKAKPDRPRAQPPKKPKLPWKRNIYPPKSKEERIVELRKRAPPLEMECLKTDKLPGVWEPELMIEAFKTLSQEVKEESEKDECVTGADWWTMFAANRKCLEWLNSIPDTC